MKITILTDDKRYVLLPSNHPLASYEAVSLADLFNETFLVTPWSYSILQGLSEYMDISSLSVKYEKNRARIINNIAFGHGIAIYYESDIRLFKLDNIAVRPLADAPYNSLVLMISGSGSYNPSQKVFRDFIVSAFQSERPRSRAKIIPLIKNPATGGRGMSFL
jgi:hypothetical protein